MLEKGASHSRPENLKNNYVTIYGEIMGRETRIL